MENVAVECHIDRFIEEPSSFLQSNIMGIATLMDAYPKYGIQRYHQVSIDEVLNVREWSYIEDHSRVIDATKIHNELG